MKAFMVSLDIATTSETLTGLSKRLGINPSPTSHDKGSRRRVKGVWEETVWRFESAAGDTASLEEHCKSIFERFPISILHRSNILPGDAKLCLNIAVFFDTAMASLAIPAKYVDVLHGSGSNIEVSCYPCTFDENREVTRTQRRSAVAKRKRKARA